MASNPSPLKTVVTNKSASNVLSHTFAGVIAAALSVGAVTSVLAQGGTESQREACMPDAFKLCSMAMPDEKRVENCLRAAGPRLSAACYGVFYPQSANNAPQVTRGQAPARARPSTSDRPQTSSMPQAEVDDD